MAEAAGEDSSAAKQCLEHLQYLNDYWMNEDLWWSWSDFGCRAAAHLLSCNFEGVIPTTNHLESFNGVLEHKHLVCWQKGGRRLCVDILIHILATKVLLSIFEQCHFKNQEEEHWKQHICELLGGEALLKSGTGIGMTPTLTVAYISQDVSRDAAAADLLNRNFISLPTFHEGGVMFNCYSSLKTQYEVQHLVYGVCLGYNGLVKCSCQDYTTRLNVCKHIHASLLKLDALHQHGVNFPHIPVPISESEACLLQAQIITFAPALSRLNTFMEAQESPITRTAAVVEDFFTETPAAFVEEPQDTTSTEEQEAWNDMESIATDAEDEFDFSVLKSSSKAGLDVQSFARLAYEL
ncbi:hypothetical protein M422DRAFT_270272 [Sphaerobolus stellatus SS14]|uniref:SWIM-type domain-containing protein n=1 Tax=Sphaerobolus stellatus (strain SS14) TaxID=990650 RepID=A0A0C9TGA3_SPHS4|nr:hypothetical protein M422DRAFT_270272 [Sphaerobolus stellatus SS14]